VAVVGERNGLDDEVVWDLWEIEGGGVERRRSGHESADRK